MLPPYQHVSEDFGGLWHSAPVSMSKKIMKFLDLSKSATIINLHCKTVYILRKNKTNPSSEQSSSSELKEIMVVDQLLKAV